MGEVVASASKGALDFGLADYRGRQMYLYDQYDDQLIGERVAEFSDQLSRYQAGELSDDEFLPLRLQNGLYLQKHAYMLRVAIPYGTLSSVQMRALAAIAHRFDKGFGHLTTRQNIQFNWITLEHVPEILALLAEVKMHAIQTSGNCVRNITTEQFAGVAADEFMDPRPFAEILRQWSTFNPEFLYLPRKFKIAVSSSSSDRAAIQMHDVGLYLYQNEEGDPVLRVMAGGGLGRTPMLGVVIRDQLPWQHLLTYVEAILRVYNRYGRRDNKYRARIKILVKSLGVEAFSQEVESEWQYLKDGPATLTEEEYNRVAKCFSAPHYESLHNENLEKITKNCSNVDFTRWISRSVHAHKVPGYTSVTLSTKPGITAAPGDLTASQMQAIADCADKFGFSEIRVTHEQNIVLPDVRQQDLFELWQHVKQFGLSASNVGLLTDIICCPGGDFCSLANARSIPVAHAIQRHFDDFDFIHDLGDLSLNLSGCINACGHHHIGNIGILGVDKDGQEWYQITLGGSQGNFPSLGKVIGRSFHAEQVPAVIAKILETFCAYRWEGEPFIETFRRIGITPFQESVYGDDQLRSIVS